MDIEQACQDVKDELAAYMEDMYARLMSEMDAMSQRWEERLKESGRATTDSARGVDTSWWEERFKSSEEKVRSEIQKQIEKVLISTPPARLASTDSVPGEEASRWEERLKLSEEKMRSEIQKQLEEVLISIQSESAVSTQVAPLESRIGDFDAEGLETRFKALQAQTAETGSVLGSMRAELHEMQAKLAQLQSHPPDSTSRIVSDGDQVGLMRSELHELQAKVAQLQCNPSDSTSRMTSDGEQLGLLKAEINDLKTQIAFVSEAQLQSQSSDSVSHVASDGDQVGLLRAEISAMKKQIALLSEAQLQTQSPDSISRIADDSDQVGSLRAEINEMKAQVHEIKVSTVQRTNVKDDSLTMDSVSGVRQSLALLEGRQNNLQKAIKELKSESWSFNQLSNITRMVDELDARVAQKVDGLDARVARAQDLTAPLSQGVSDVSANIRMLQERVESAEAAHERAHASAVASNSRAEAAHAAIADMNHHVQAVTSQMDDHEKKLEKAAHFQTTFTCFLEDVRRKHAQLLEHMAEVNEAHSTHTAQHGSLMEIVAQRVEGIERMLSGEVVGCKYDLQKNLDEYELFRRRGLSDGDLNSPALGAEKQSNCYQPEPSPSSSPSQAAKCFQP